MGLFRAIGHGLAAGAAGTTGLNAATYLDMALRARPSSPMPAKAVDKLAEDAGQSIPSEGESADNRREGLGALFGIGTGLGVGVVAGLLGPVLTRVPTVLGAAVIGGAAMAASDVPMVALGLTDPKKWCGVDWASDAAPHLAYGLVTLATLRALHKRAIKPD